MKELSKKSKYWLPRHRYYELLHFCRQYADWKLEYEDIDIPSADPSVERVQVSKDADAVLKQAMRRADLASRIDIYTMALNKIEDELKNYIFLATTKGYSYEFMDSRYGMPCCRNTFYDRYRKFFYELNLVRG